MVRLGLLVVFLFVCATFVAPTCLVAWAADDEDDFGLGVGKEGLNTNVDKAQVSQMIDLMQSQGQISAEDAAKAKQELSQKSDADMQNLQKNAMDRIKSGNVPTLPPVSPPPATNTTHAPASVPAVASSVSPQPVVPAATKATQASPAVEDRSKKLQDAFQYINQ